ncbi:hypothetical protein [Nocardioides sp.]|uniref:hypothetical protein n=1 Tax=Nocardioides sp. TaxID=35761 RepID=UPI002720625C|nr:hypothetical protein [Nocardioides sp.]MDO9454641.1 hypothetical protein [Nocardioides sp.]
MLGTTALALFCLVPPGVAYATTASATASARVAQRTVTDGANPRALLDLRSVTYRHGPRAIGVSTAVASVPAAGSVVLTLESPESSDFAEIYLDRDRDGQVTTEVQFSYLEDVTDVARCAVTHRWDRRKDVVGVAVDSPCLARFVSRRSSSFDLDLVEATVTTSTSRFTRVDNARSAVLDVR